MTGALAASLVELAARFAGDDEAVARAQALGARLARLADDDVAAYGAFMSERSPAARQRIIEVPEEIAADADEIAELAAQVVTELSSSVAGDAEVAVELARAAARAARRLSALNARESTD